MRVSFFGTPEISKVFLEHLLKKEEVVSVITAPDKPSGRGLTLRPSPVKEFATKNNLKIFTPENLKDNDFISQLSSVNSQLFVVVSYGKIIPSKIFNIPQYGTINVHFSLLPKYRGAAPIQWALINGDKTTGVTVFFIDEGLDTGDILLQKEVSIHNSDDYFSLEKKLTAVGLEVLSEAMTRIKSGSYNRLKQTGEPSFAPPFKKTDGKINWGSSSVEIYNLIRGLRSWPVAYTTLPDSTTLKIYLATPTEVCPGDGSACHSTTTSGQVISIAKNKGFIVKCGKGFLLILEVQPENRRKMSAWDFLQSGKLKIGDVLM